MRHWCRLCFVTACCLIASGCGTAKIQELTAEVARLKAATADLEAKNAALQAELTQAKQEAAQVQQPTADLEAKNAALQAELTQAKQEAAQVQQHLAEIAEIKKGYEEARVKFEESFKQLAPMLGLAGSPLPPFEGLKDSSWVGKFAPPANLAPDMKALQNELQGLMGEGFKLPKQ